LKSEAVEDQYFDPANMAPEKMASIIANLDSKVTLFKQFEETSERYNDW